jgi:hypothetical protein
MSTLSSLQGQFHTLRRRAKTIVGARPTLFFPLFRPRSAFEDLLVTRSTDLCVEGFPRSANSFSVQALRYAQPQPVEIAHHTHVPANAIRACEWGIPTVILIRSPYDAIVSRIALDKEVQVVEHDVTVPRQRVSFAAWIQAWLSFYRALVPYRIQERLLVAPFSVAIQDMGHIIEQINARFGTNFESFNHTDEAVATVRAGQGYHAGPNDRRNRFKDETRTDFDEALQTDSTLERRMAEADQLFSEYVEEAAIVRPHS